MMLLPYAIRLLYCLLIAFLISGCARFNSTHPSILAAPQPHVTAAPNTESAADELLNFAVDMAKLPDVSRAEKCQTLLDTPQTPANDSLQLHLVVGRLLSDACGDISTRLEEIERLKASYASDKKLQQLLILHEQILINMHNQAQKLAAIENKRQRNKSTVESKEALESKDNETRLLREKLEAIRSMEKQLDESSNK